MTIQFNRYMQANTEPEPGTASPLDEEDPEKDGFYELKGKKDAGPPKL